MTVRERSKTQAKNKLTATYLVYFVVKAKASSNKDIKDYIKREMKEIVESGNASLYAVRKHRTHFDKVTMFQ